MSVIEYVKGLFKLFILSVAGSTLLNFWRRPLLSVQFFLIKGKCNALSQEMFTCPQNASWLLVYCYVLVKDPVGAHPTGSFSCFYVQVFGKFRFQIHVLN